MNAKRLDLVVLVLMAFIAFFSGHMFFSSSVDRAIIPKDILAILEQGTNVIKVRPGGAPFWKDAKSSEQLGDRDLVYTHNNSSANIRLSHGGTISLHENTLFRLIKGNEGNALLDLKKGAIKAFLYKGTRLRLSKTRSVITSSDSEVLIYNDAGKKRLSLVKGKLLIKEGDHSLAIQRGQELILDKQDRIVVSDNLNVTPLSPTSSQTIYFHKMVRVSFDWHLEGSSKGKKVILISRTPNFLKSTTVKKAISLKEEGHFYWKVGLRTKNGTRWSSPFDFKLVKDIPPQLISPASGAVALELDPFDQAESSFVTLKWRDSKALRYKVEITSPTGQSQEYISESNTQPVDLFNLGQYKVRVTALFANRSVSGAFSHFTIVEKSRPTVPTLIFPRDKASFSVFDKQGVGVHFTWHTPRQNVESIIEVLDLKGSLVSSKRVRGSSTFIKINRFGKFSWRVRSESGPLHSSFSPNNSFTIKYAEINAKYPEAGSKFQLSRPKQTVRFEWGGAKSAKVYLYELSKTENFDEIIYTKKVRGKKINVNFPTVGVFFWRTKVIDEKGGLSFSRPVKVIVSPTPPPIAPVLDPIRYFEIDLQRGSPSSFLKRFIDFVFPPVFASDETEANISWRHYSNAKQYILEIYRDPNGKKVVLKRIVDTNSFSFVNPEAGDYYWRIAIVDHWGRKGPFSNFAQMKLKLSERLTPMPPAQLLIPGHRQTISNKQTFVWRSVPRAKNYTIEFSKDLSFKTIVTSKKTSRAKIELKLFEFKNSFPLYWRVVSADTFKNISLSKRRSIALPPAPKKVILKSSTLSSLSNRVAVQLGMALTEYKLERNTNTYSAEGPLSSLSLVGERNLIWGKFISGFSLLRGSIYEQEFTTFGISLKGGRTLFKTDMATVDWYLGLRATSIPYYNTPRAFGSLPELDGSKVFFLPVGSLSMIYPLSKSEIYLSGEVGALSVISFQINLGWRYLLKRQGPGALLSFENTQGTVDGSKIKMKSIAAALSYFLKF
ncbi:MAG: hypothetical protein KAG61_04020 [Bacteriovoracaceae bacterium]|nr:hypothetical protein [Bacteriovoracaceae bacterium]